MFSEELERQNAEAFVEIEKINNGYLVTSVKGRVHCRTFNGLIRALELLYKTRMILSGERVEEINN